MPLPDKIFVGQNSEVPKVSPLVGPYETLTVLTGRQDSNGKDIAYTYKTSPGATGLELEVSNPYADEDMARNMAYIFFGGEYGGGGFEYQPFDAENTLLDPSAEVGDAITVGTIYSGIYSIINHVEPLYLSQPAAPFNDEYESEYPYKTKEQRQFSQDKAANRASLTILNDRITQEVENIDGRITELTVTADGLEAAIRNEVTNRNAAIQASASEITAYVDNQDDQISARLTIAEDEISSKVSQDDLESAIEQNLDGITLSVSNRDSSSVLTISHDGIALDSATIRFTGVVTFDDLETEGETTINGANITTGTISADRIATNISQVAHTLTIGGSTSQEVHLYFGVAGSKTHIYTDSRVGELFFVSDEINIAGKYGLRMFVNNSGDASFGTNDGDIYVGGDRVFLTTGSVSADTSGSNYVQLNNVLSGLSSLRPRYDDDLSLGTSSYRWSQVYAVTSAISTSDRERKTNISYDLSKYDKLFDSLMPASFKMKDGSSGRTHLGLIAQDIEKELEEAGLTPKEFAAFCKDQKEDEFGPIDGYEYGLRYEEFIGLLIRQIQMLKERVKVLEDARD